MITSKDFIDKIAKQVQDRPLRDVAVRLTTGLASRPSSETNFLSYTSLASIAGCKPDDKLLLLSVAILTADIASVLTPFFVCIKDEDREWVLSPEEFSEAQTTGKLFDPETGREVADFEAHVYPFFATTSEFNQARSSED